MTRFGRLDDYSSRMAMLSDREFYMPHYVNSVLSSTMVVVKQQLQLTMLPLLHYYYGNDGSRSKVMIVERQ